MIIDTDSPPPWASLSTADICTYSLLDTAIRWQHNDHLQPSACQEVGGGGQLSDIYSIQKTIFPEHPDKSEILTEKCLPPESRRIG